MKTLAAQISKLLFEHDCVIVPGLGGFITNYKPAIIHPQHHTFHPPSKQIIFNAALNSNDGILINAYCGIFETDFTTAAKIIDQKVHTIRISLLKGERVTLENIGELSLNRENNIEFHPSNKINYLGEAYGLTRFDYAPVNRELSTPIIGISRQTARKTMKWAAIVAPIAALALWTTLNTGTLNRIYDNYASLIPAKTETAEYKASPSQESAKKTATLEVARVAPVQEVTEAADEEVHVNTTPAVASISYHIIAGAFSIPENAGKYVEQLKAEGYHATLVGPNRKNLHLVSIQSFSNQETATARMHDLHRNGFPAAWILEKAN